MQLYVPKPWPVTLTITMISNCCTINHLLIVISIYSSWPGTVPEWNNLPQQIVQEQSFTNI